jgi:hypothetical protein
LRAVEHWPLVLALSLTAGAGVWLWTRRRPSAAALLEADAKDPYRRWVQNAFLLVTGDCDYAHLSGAEARRVLAHWWDVYGPVELRRTLRRLADPSQGEHAWPLLRFILVSRLGVAAGMVHDEVSWDEILPVARRLQAAYPSWRAMAQDYVRARRQWRDLPLDGSADDEGMTTILDNLARLDDTRWRELDYKAELWPAEATDVAEGFDDPSAAAGGYRDDHAAASNGRASDHAHAAGNGRDHDHSRVHASGNGRDHDHPPTAGNGRDHHPPGPNGRDHDDPDTDTDGGNDHD